MFISHTCRFGVDPHVFPIFFPMFHSFHKIPCWGSQHGPPWNSSCWVQRTPTPPALAMTPDPRENSWPETLVAPPETGDRRQLPCHPRGYWPNISSSIVKLSGLKIANIYIFGTHVVNFTDLSRQSGSNLLRNGWLDGLGWKAEDQARWVLNVLTLLGTKYGLRARPILGRTQNNPYIIIYLQHSSTKCFILDTDVTWTLCLLEDWGRLLFVVRDRHLDHFLYFQWFSSHPNPLRNQHIPYVRCPPDVGLSVYNPHFDNVRYIYI